MKKKLVSLLLATTVLVGLVGCGGKTDNNASANVDSTCLEALKTSVDGLKNTKEYVITTDIDMPASSSSYIEVVRENFNYTEYPVDSEGNIINKDSEEYGSGYMLADWMTPDTFYTYSVNSNGEAGFYILPKSYREVCANRTTLYTDIIFDGLVELKQIESQTTDMGDGEKEYTMYKGKITADAVRKLIEPNAYALYDSIIKDYPDNANMVKYAQYIKDDMDFNLVYGGGNITFAVTDNVLRGYTLEIGGLGTRMYITKSVITNEQGVREEPDFSGATDYVASIQDTADYVCQFDSYEDALTDMYKNQMQTPNETNITDPTQTTESTETTETTESTTTDTTDTSTENTEDVSTEATDTDAE